ncbi:MalM family protein, partial [Salmonella enterica subsp. enterica serovar Montevideo]|nr:MalM family protein [Salmonella enterica subsp. enterica serovar Montevideo]
PANIGELTLTLTSEVNKQASVFAPNVLILDQNMTPSAFFPSSELCTLFLDPEWRKEGNGYLLSKSRFMFMAAFRDKFNEKVV